MSVARSRLIQRFGRDWMIYALFHCGVEYLISQNSGFWDSLYVGKANRHGRQTSGRPPCRGDIAFSFCVVIEPVNGENGTIGQLHRPRVADIVVPSAVTEDNLVAPRHTLIVADAGPHAQRDGSDRHR